MSISDARIGPQDRAPVHMPVRSRTRSVVAIKGHPVYLMLDHFPIACFTLTLATDVFYWMSSNLMWQHFSEWLLLAGLIAGGLQFVCLLVDVVASRVLRATGMAWTYVVGLLFVLVLATLNSFVHAADGWVGVVPWGLVLSAATFVALVVTAWFGREMAYRSIWGVLRDV